ncbi:PLAC8 family-domain-containing protein [Mycena epipterygia]|nr:PLAC8 family-domain-containing protein [Mycena epipterygia]
MDPVLGLSIKPDTPRCSPCCLPFTPTFFDFFFLHDKHGLCGCFEACGTFCCACWCPCVVHGKNKQRVSHLNDRNSPDPDGGSCCSGSCWAHCCLTSFLGAGFILQCINRGEVRGRYGVEGGGCGDCCASFCCGPCDLTQVSREIELEEKSFNQRY